MHLFIGLLLVLLDQLSKLVVQTLLPPGHSLPVISPWFYLTHVQNPGAAFGLMANKTILFIIITIAAGVVVWYKRAEIAKQSPLFRWGVTLALAGAGGNLIDRIRVGRVVDFIDIRFFWVFNLADICIVGGVALLIWCISRMPAQQGEEIGG